MGNIEWIIKLIRNVKIYLCVVVENLPQIKRRKKREEKERRLREERLR